MRSTACQHIEDEPFSRFLMRKRCERGATAKAKADTGNTGSQDKFINIHK
jgi:hypothetical protein